MDLGLQGKKAIIGASSKGLGKACAKALAQAGCDITINGRDIAGLEKTANEIRQQTGVRVEVVAGNISDRDVQQAILDICPVPDILVNNNGGPPFCDFQQLDRKAILDGVTQNMVTPIELIQSVIEGMVARKFGRIVNITSTSVYKPIAGLDLSSGARAGLTAFLAGVAQSVIVSNVTINNLLPGTFNTDRIQSSIAVEQKKTAQSIEEIVKKREAKIPARRFGTPEEFGQACAFLCSTHSGYITGQNLVIDGGAYASAF